MNDYPTSVLEAQLRLAARHRGYIILALRELKKASSGQITKKVKEYAFAESETEKRYTMEELQMSKRTVQKYLRSLEKEGIVYDAGLYEYALSDAGHRESILAEEFGRVLFEGLTALPLSGSLEKKVLESIHRLGVYMAYILIRHSISLDMSSREEIHRHDADWLNSAFSPVILFNWFEKIIYGSKAKTRNNARYEQVWNIIGNNFSKEFQTFVESEKSFNAKVMNDLREDLLKQASKLQSRSRST